MQRLDSSHYQQALAPLSQIPFNTIFARSVLETGKLGSVYVDNTEDPKTFYVTHSYGMALLFGASDNDAFNQSFKDYALNVSQTRNTFEWLQVYPNDWHTVLKDMLGEKLIQSADTNANTEVGYVALNTRVNFKFNTNQYLQNVTHSTMEDVTIVRTDKEIFSAMKGSVIPSYFWENEDDFLENGVGFSLFFKGQLASTVYSAFVIGTQLELGIETVGTYRGKGFAEQVCKAILDYCITHNFEPIWACRLENVGSYKLAQKLGFTPTLEIPFYRLSR